MAKVKDFYGFIDSFAPFSSQEEWDNSGLLVGSGENEVTKVLVALDITPETVKEAKENGCELIVSHHPIIFSAQKSFTDGSLAYLCARENISVISAHTCYDFAEGGVSDTLAAAAGLTNIRKAPSGEYTLGETAFNTAGELAQFVKEKLSSEISLCLKDKPIKTVAVCGGAGSDFIFDALENGADAFLTGEAKHHEFLDAKSCGIALICAGHFETEVIAMKPLAEKLAAKFGDTQIILMKQSSPIEHI